MRTKSEQGMPVSSVASATRYVRRMAEIETRGFGDDEQALRRLEAKFGIGYWTLRYLKLGRAATVDSELLARLKAAYLSYVEQKVDTLQHELATERAIEPDADLELLEAQASELAAKIKAAKIQRLIRRGRG